MAPCAHVHRLSVAGPDDVSPLAAALDSGDIAAESVVAVLGKTEGNGCVNDFSRGFAGLALKTLLAERLRLSPRMLEQRVVLVMSGGTEGGLSPHLLVFCRSDGSAALPGRKALAIGVGFTPDMLPEELGRMPQVEQTALAVRRAVAAAGIESMDDVHFVQVKCPLLIKPRIAEAASRGKSVVTLESYESMARSRGAAALGVALALGEATPDAIAAAASSGDAACYSARASCSAGIELVRNEVMVLGNSVRWSGDLRIAHGVMNDALDLEAPRDVLARLGIAAAVQLDSAARRRIAAVLAKAEASRSGLIRGHRHTMLDDSDIHTTRHARALVGGVLAGLFGDTRLFVSGGAEHQGPDGGGPVAVIADCAGS